MLASVSSGAIRGRPKIIGKFASSLINELYHPQNFALHISLVPLHWSSAKLTCAESKTPIAILSDTAHARKTLSSKNSFEVVNQQMPNDEHLLSDNGGTCTAAQIASNNPTFTK